MEENEKEGQLEVSDHDMLVEIYSFIKNMKAGYEQVIANAHIDRETLQQLLGVSQRTLQRWRDNGTLPYYIEKDGSSYYVYEEIYMALKRGQLIGKRLNRIAAMQRMKSYSQGLLKGFNNDELEEEDFR